MLQVIEQARKHGDGVAIESHGSRYTYAQLLEGSESLAQVLMHGRTDLDGSRIAFMVHPGFDYVRTLWAIWRAGGVAVPLCLTHPLPSLQYVIEDTDAEIILVSKEFVPVLKDYASGRGLRLLVIEELGSPLLSSAGLPDVAKDRNALILYTSGTTNKPKGVVTTHANIEAQIGTLVSAWEWTSMDHTLCVLPLHHVHGIINVIGCSMWVGATCAFIPHFSADTTFKLFRQGKLNVFMAVPTIYFKLIAHFETMREHERADLTKAMSAFRLMVCGSAALPVTVMEKWERISGHRLLERYGMTELGMAISNPYHGERRAGHVGTPLPSVQVRLVDDQGNLVEAGAPGEIQVKGPNVFKEYWGKPDATRETFTEDGWFKTGDVAVVEEGYYRIMGRSSVDIIKSGGYKISALEIEEVLRTHDWIDDCAVVGIDDEEWGELIVAAVIPTRSGRTAFDPVPLNEWLVQRMAGYKKPRRYLVVNELPRNAMGKVVKNDVKKLFTTGK